MLLDAEVGGLDQSGLGGSWRETGVCVDGGQGGFQAQMLRSRSRGRAACDCAAEKPELRLSWVSTEKKVVGNLELLEPCEHVSEAETHRAQCRTAGVLSAGLLVRLIQSRGGKA